MKTTVDISDPLLARAKRHARSIGKPLRSVIEDGLRLVLKDDAKRSNYQMPDRSVGEEGGHNPLEGLSWQDLRAEIHGDPRP